MFGPNNASAVATPPARVNTGPSGFFGAGDPATGVLPTLLDGDFMNGLLAELLAILAQAGIAPSATQFAQLLQALQTISEQVGDARYVQLTNSSGFVTPQQLAAAIAGLIGDPSAPLKTLLAIDQKLVADEGAAAALTALVNTKVNRSGDSMGPLTVAALVNSGSRTTFGFDGPAGQGNHFFAVAGEAAGEPGSLGYGFSSDGSHVTGHRWLVNGVTVVEIGSDGFMRGDAVLPVNANDSRFARTDWAQTLAAATLASANAHADSDASPKVNRSGDSMGPLTVSGLTNSSDRTDFGFDTSAGGVHWFAVAGEAAGEPGSLGYGFSSDGSHVTGHNFGVGGAVPVSILASGLTTTGLTAATSNLGGIVVDGNIHGATDAAAFTLGGSSNAQSGRVVVWGIGSPGAGQVVIGNDQHNVTITRGARPQVDGKDLVDAGGGQSIAGTTTLGAVSVTGDATVNRSIAPTLTSPTGQLLSLQAGGNPNVTLGTDGFARLVNEAERTANDSRMIRADWVRQLGKFRNGQGVISGSGSMVAANCGSFWAISASGLTISLPGSGLIGGDTLEFENQGGGASTIAAPSGLVLFDPAVGSNVGSINLPNGWWAELIFDGGTTWKVRSLGPAQGGSKLQTLAGYPINIASGSTSYDLTWAPGAYDRMLLSIASFTVSNGNLAVGAFRDGNGNWTGNNFLLSSTGTGGPTGLLVNGANLGTTLFLAAGTGAGTGFVSLPNGMSGIRLQSSIGGNAFSANGVLLDGA